MKAGNQKIRITYMNGNTTTGHLENLQTEGIEFLEECKVFNCNKKIDEQTKRYYFIPWHSILNFEIL